MTGEDQDLSWRGLLYGYRHFLSARALTYHYYQFGRHRLNKYREEKNRLTMILKNYSCPTLMFLAPVFLITELGIVLFSLFEGWFFLKVKGYFLVLVGLSNILSKRRKIQKARKINDRQLLPLFQSTIQFAPIDNFVIKYLANPVYWLYYRLLLLFLKLSLPDR